MAIGFGISQIGIKKYFNYPKILRNPVSEILQIYNSNRKKIRISWTIFSFSSLMLIAVAGILYDQLNTSSTPYLIIGTFFGVAAAIFYVLGLMRWVFLADNLSTKYIKWHDDKQKMNQIEMIFESFHVYCGNSIGETMGFFCMGIWAVITGIAILFSGSAWSVLGALYILAGTGIGIAPLEWIGFKQANKINKISMKIFMVCLIAIAMIILIK